MREFCRIAAALLLILSTVGSGLAFSVSFSSGPAPVALRWRAAKAIPISVSPSLVSESPNIKSDSDVSGAIQRSLESWEKVADIKFRRVDTEKQSVSPAGIAGDGVSLITIAQTPENTLLFAKDPERAAATTRIFYNGRGLITEADIALNPYQQFSTDGTPGTFDLESTLTHEIGHLLGLDHSLLPGSTMHLNYGKNGTFGIQNFAARTLSAEDIAAARAIYGSPIDETECCGSISGKLAWADGKPARNIRIWIEDEFGRVNGEAFIADDGTFRFAGLNPGEYVAFADAPGDAASSQPVQEVGKVIVEYGATATLNAQIERVAVEPFLSHLGLNGELSDLAIPLTAGRTHRIYLGGRNLDHKRTAIRFSSPYLDVISQSAAAHDYGADVSVISFEVRVRPQTPAGEYTIFASLENGMQIAVPGGLTVEGTQNSTIASMPPVN